MIRPDPARGSRSRGGTTAAQWPLALALLVLLLVALSALGPLLRGTAWWWLMAVVAVLVFTAAALLRSLGLSRPLVPVATLGVLVAAATLVFGQGTGLLWLLPTPGTIEPFAELARAGADSINQQSTPAEAIGGILFLLFVGAGLIAVLMDLLAITHRMPALAGLPLLVPLTLPGLLIPDADHVGVLVATALAYLVVLRVDGRRRRTGQTIGRRGPGVMAGPIMVGGIGVISALLLSLVAPVWSETTFAGSRGSSLFGGGVSPMIDLGQDLRRPAAGAALHYRSTAQEMPYFKILTLDDFEGTTWTSRTPEVDRANTVERIDRPPGLLPAVRSTPTTTTIVIDGVNTDLLPAPSPATSVRGLTGQWYWDDVSLTIASPDSNTLGQAYTVEALDLAPTAEQLRDSGARYPASVTTDLELPAERPAIIDETAREVTAGTESAYDAAVALQEYLRGNEFSYDTEAPVDDGYDGGGLGVLGTFLDVKSGYCVHFASAMAVMARVLEIPARISVGYLPGTRARDAGASTGTESDTGDGPARYDIDSHDLHAWPELYFVGVGWVPFEPTPGRGSVPDYARPAAAAAPGSAPGANPATSAPRPDQVSPTDDAGAPSQSADPDQDAGNRLGIVAILAGVLLLALALVPGVARRLRRTRRLRSIRAGTQGAAAAWAEVSDTAIDHGVRVRATDTPRELARTFQALIGAEAADALARILVAVERHRFARAGQPAPEGARLATDLEQVVRALRDASDALARWRAVLLPASLTTAAMDALRGPANGQAPGGA